MSEAFEKWALENKLPIGASRDDDGYEYIGTRIAYRAWQASRKLAIEECIAAADEAEWCDCNKVTDAVRALQKD